MASDGREGPNRCLTTSYVLCPLSSHSSHVEYHPCGLLLRLCLHKIVRNLSVTHAKRAPSKRAAQNVLLNPVDLGNVFSRMPSAPPPLPPVRRIGIFSRSLASISRAWLREFLHHITVDSMKKAAYIKAATGRRAWGGRRWGGGGRGGGSGNSGGGGERPENGAAKSGCGGARVARLRASQQHVPACQHWALALVAVVVIPSITYSGSRANIAEMHMRNTAPKALRIEQHGAEHTISTCCGHNTSRRVVRLSGAISWDS